jgi:feruloyl esterase
MRYAAAIAFLMILSDRTAHARNCEELSRLALPNAKITMSTLIPAGTRIEPSQHATDNLPEFCRVAATLTPSADSDIRIEVWMPTSAWNGKFEGTGNGGYAGIISYAPLAEGLRAGYATANTDMGTAPSTWKNGDPLIDHPEKWADWGWRATHVMTEVAKQIIREYYSRNPTYSYFVGCSTGGEQALMEAQRFPDDYDGIVAGAPANNRTHLHIDILWNAAAGMADPTGYLPETKLKLITKTVLSACENEKAVESDSFLSIDPADCHWDPEELLCKSGKTENCLTAAQVATTRKLYDGPVDPTTSRPIYPGVPRGSEFGWNQLMLVSGEPPFISLFKWIFGPGWDWRRFNYSSDVTVVDNHLASILNATNPDLGAFKRKGHKLIAFHGWADWLVPSQESISYFRAVSDQQIADATSHHRDKFDETESFYRLFMIPGMSHCSGGPGLNSIDALPSLARWVETGFAPETIVAEHLESGSVTMVRPVCPYPKQVRYQGHGDTNTLSSFSCAIQGAGQ